jgi:hypothetical protein
MNGMVRFVSFARGIVYLAYALAVLLLAIETAPQLVQNEIIRSTSHLPPNHLLAPADFSSPATAALVNRYLRTEIAAGKPITPDMVSASPVVPVVPAGIALILNMDRAQLQRQHFTIGQEVEIQKDGQTLQKGRIIALPCDETRCAVLVGVVKSGIIDGPMLTGAEVVASPPVTLHTTPPKEPSPRRHVE